MWILFKLIAMFLSAIARIFGNNFSLLFADKKMVEGRDSKIYIIKHRSRYSVLGTSFVIDLDLPVKFKLTNEAKTDRFFKNLGLAKELQTGDRDFDSKIYVCSDSKLISRKLAGDSELRKLILNFFNSGAKYLKFDGKLLRLYLPGDVAENQLIQQELVDLRDYIKKDRTIKIGFLDDPFIWKVLVTEIFIWSLFGYSIIGFFEWMTNRQDYHLDSMLVVQQGVVLSIVGLFSLLALIVLIFRGSSRGHRIIIESALFIGLSMPLAGVNIIADLNIQLDTKPSIWISSQVIDMEQRKHKSKNGYYYTYYLYFKDTSNNAGLEIPRYIQVTKEVFKKGTINSIAKIEVGPGFLGHPWYRSFSFS